MGGGCCLFLVQKQLENFKQLLAMKGWTDFEIENGEIEENNRNERNLVWLMLIVYQKL
jgi:hypothetical protein